MTLRILTEKSKMKFGKYHDNTVQDIFAIDQLHYLIWIYYNSSHISFHTSVLEKLGIIGDRVITKPGKDPEQGRIVKDEYNMNKFDDRHKVRDEAIKTGDWTKYHKLTASNIKMKRDRSDTTIKTIGHQSAAKILQRRNHGH